MKTSVILPKIVRVRIDPAPGGCLRIVYSERFPGRSALGRKTAKMLRGQLESLIPGCRIVVRKDWVTVTAVAPRGPIGDMMFSEFLVWSRIGKASFADLVMRGVGIAGAYEEEEAVAMGLLINAEFEGSEGLPTLPSRLGPPVPVTSDMPFDWTLADPNRETS